VSKGGYKPAPAPEQPPWEEPLTYHIVNPDMCVAMNGRVSNIGLLRHGDPAKSKLTNERQKKPSSWRHPIRNKESIAGGPRLFHRLWDSPESKKHHGCGGMETGKYPADMNTLGYDPVNMFGTRVPNFDDLSLRRYERRGPSNMTAKGLAWMGGHTRQVRDPHYTPTCTEVFKGMPLDAMDELNDSGVWGGLPKEHAKWEKNEKMRNANSLKHQLGGGGRKYLTGPQSGFKGV